MRGRLWGALVALIVVLSPVAAKAEWLRAESERFIVYSDGGERSLRTFVQDLETFDRVLRFRNGLSMDGVPPRKLPIYLVRNRAALLDVNPGAGDDTAGFYVSTGEDIFAVAIRSRSQDWIMLHEYAHHFMLQNFAAGYPGWFVEGFAEYYMATQIWRGNVEVGGFVEGRLRGLNENWLPLEDLLTKRGDEIVGHSDRATYYPVAWVLTHWFMGSEERRPLLDEYIRAVGQGEEPVATMERVTAMTLAELRQTLREYTRRSIPYVRINYDFPEVEVEIEPLPPSADDLLLISQRLKIGVPEEDDAETVAEVRRLAARHPGDPLARLTLGHAELHFGDPAVGERILTALLEDDPRNVEALQWMASSRIRQAQDAPEDAERLMREARGFLARAFRVDDANFHTFSLIARSRQGAADYPSDNDMATWDLAFTLAPQLGDIRLGAARALMLRGRYEQAVVLLEPLANNPHGGPGMTIAQTLIEEARAALDGATPAEGEIAAETGASSEPGPDLNDEGG